MYRYHFVLLIITATLTLVASCTQYQTIHKINPGSWNNDQNSQPRITSWSINYFEGTDYPADLDNPEVALDPFVECGVWSPAADDEYLPTIVIDSSQRDTMAFFILNFDRMMSTQITEGISDPVVRFRPFNWARWVPIFPLPLDWHWERMFPSPSDTGRYIDGWITPFEWIGYARIPRYYMDGKADLSIAVFFSEGGERIDSFRDRFYIHTPARSPEFTDLEAEEIENAAEGDSVIRLGLHPNPTRDMIYYDRGDDVISIFNASGRKLAEFRYQMDISFLPNGIYFLTTPQGIGQIVKE